MDSTRRRQRRGPTHVPRAIYPQPEAYNPGKVVLHKADKPWMPQGKAETADVSAEGAQSTELYRTFQGILNKLTPQKFQALAEQVLKLEINTEERLSGCIDKIFTKALGEPRFSIAYANLCKVMSPIKVEFVSEDGKTKLTNFRRMLLTKLQKEFEKDKKDDENLETMLKEIEKAETDENHAVLKVEMEIAVTKMRRRSLGNIRFIGELFKLQMLSEAIMHECITRLLKSTSDEESLECFARLITTTGKDLDKEAARSRIDAYFRRINEIIKKGKVPARVRFMLQDVIELREHKWVPRVQQDQQLETTGQMSRQRVGSKKIIHQPTEKMGQQRIESRRIIPQPIKKKVVLHKAENPWMPRMKAETADVSAEGAQSTELYRKFQGILNKLTPQKFHTLAKQALKLEINTEVRLSGCVAMVFYNTMADTRFAIAYANLCKVMSPIKVEFVSEEGKTRHTNFRRMLLTKCQKEFEKDKKDDENLETMLKEIEKAETDEKRAALKEEMEVAVTKMRRRSLGNIRFIGELFKLQMLSEAIMHECITRLLKSTSDEESLECFARLITTTGRDLDKAAVRSRIDTYFRRISEIIKKGKVPARVRFMLQDVIELREHKWVPRVRQDQQLKTIDQIHAEAAREEAKEKEMIQQSGAERRDWRNGCKDDHAPTDRESRRERQRFDQSKLKSLMSKKEKANSGQSHVGLTAVIRPAAGWKKSGLPASQRSDGAKSTKAPPRSAIGLGMKSRTDARVGGRAPLQGPRHSHTTPEAEKASLLQTVNDFAISKPLEAVPLGCTSHVPSAQAILCSHKRPVVAPPAITEEMIATAQQRVTSTIDELVDNKDYKEAIECVKEIDLPGAMKHVVVEGINHTLERKAALRTVTGELFCRLVQEKILSQQDFSDGLNDVLEVAEDIAIDIPKIWDYLGEVLAPVLARKHISLLILKKPPTSLVESGRAAVLMAKLLSQCLAVLKGEEEVKDLWTRSGMCWDDLGIQREDLEEFLERQGLSFLKSAMVMQDLPPALLEALHTQLVSTNIPNDDISQWIKKNCADLGYDPALLVTILTSAVLLASVSGSGDHAVFHQDQFEKRVEVVKAQGHYGVAVLHGLQYSIAKLSHPPKLLHSLFNVIYDLDIVDDKEFYMWRDDDQVMYGKSAAVASTKPFFDWLKSDSKSADWM